MAFVNACFYEMKFHNENSGGAFTEIIYRPRTRIALAVLGGWMLLGTALLVLGEFQGAVRATTVIVTILLAFAILLLRILEKPVTVKVPKTDSPFIIR